MQHKSSKSVSLQVKTQTSSFSPAERENLVLALTCYSVSGQFVTPLTVLPQEDLF